MTHLLIHIVKEISILGPVFLHNMFPFERYMSVLKKYVRKRSSPEGCIAKGYATEEVIEFCIDYIDDLRPIGLPVSRHEGRLSGKGTLGKKIVRNTNNFLFDKAHLTVLQHSSLVAPYMEEHKKIILSKYHGRSEAWLQRQHTDTFATWLRDHLYDNDEIGDQLALLARGPSSEITTFKGYEINGYTFYTKFQDSKSTNQNSGVRIDALDNNGKMDTYYGFIEDIWELSYGPYLKVPLFRCQWVKLSGGGITKDRTYGMTIVDLTNTAYRDEPFVLAKDVTQVFYVNDMCSVPKKGKNNVNTSSKNEPVRHIVLPGKRKIMGVEDVIDEEDYNQFDDIPPFTVAEDTTILLNNEDAPYLRHDHKEGVLIKKKFVGVIANPK